jgi:hypothetical protein
MGRIYGEDLFACDGVLDINSKESELPKFTQIHTKSHKRAQTKEVLHDA